MEFNVAIKGWMRVDAESEAEAKEKAAEVIAWLTADAHERGHVEGTFFEEVGLAPCVPQVNPANAAMSVIMDDEDRRRMFNR